MVLREKLDKDTQLFAVCETEELQKIAQAKAEAIKADIDFSTNLPYAESDLVLVDASLVRPRELAEDMAAKVKFAKNEIAFFVATSGSYGEVFSYLWEVLMDLDLLDKGDEVENLISGLPTDLRIEEIAKNLELKKVKSKTKSEFFEFEDGNEFIDSPLMQFFLFPEWLGFLDDKEKEQVLKELAQKIDDEHDKLSFRFSVKGYSLNGAKSVKEPSRSDFVIVLLIFRGVNTLGNILYLWRFRRFNFRFPIKFSFRFFHSFLECLAALTQRFG